LTKNGVRRELACRRNESPADASIGGTWFSENNQDLIGRRADAAEP
jgi:hypothetical protein